MKHFKQGVFIPQNPHKYKGDVTNIVFRSSWEVRVMRWLDTNPSIIEWSSEEVVIPYLSPVDDQYHRYFPDFLIRVKVPDKKIKTYLLEVKPASQTKEPKKPKRKTKRFITEVMTWSVNEAKWEKAREYCADRNWEFLLVTEKEIFGK